jgi:hypothetical protein
LFTGSKAWGVAVTACIAISLAFFRYLDTREHAAAAALFADDAEWRRPGGTLRGGAAILASLAERPADRSTAHLVSNIWAEEPVAGRVWVHFYLTLRERITAAGEPPVVRVNPGVLSGTDTYIQTAAGWRILTKETQPVL